jgi:hypothetical protein
MTLPFHFAIFVVNPPTGFFKSQSMTRKQQLGIWLLLTFLLALTLFRWFNLAQ